jgi:hypothetical protein
VIDGGVYGARPNTFLLFDYQPFEVASGSLRLLSAEEYRRSFASPDGADSDEWTAMDLSPRDCATTDVPAVAHITRAQ